MNSNQNISEATAILENIDMLTIDKAWILLVFAGLKPTALLTLESRLWIDSEDEKQIDQKTWLDLQFILDELKIEYSTNITIMGHQKHMRIMNIFIAKETMLVEKVASAYEHNDEKLLGELFGFPSTAVQAFLNNDCIDSSELPESTAEVSFEDMRFLNHRLSKNNWEKEISYLPSYAKQVKQLSPTIYAQCIKLNATM